MAEEIIETVIGAENIIAAIVRAVPLSRPQGEGIERLRSWLRDGRAQSPRCPMPAPASRAGARGSS